MQLGEVSTVWGYWGMLDAFLRRHGCVHVESFNSWLEGICETKGCAEMRRDGSLE
jgi:hypothetical protein